jgi:hypothetical protein
MARFIEAFWDDDVGNSTTDWMVLTAGMVLLSAALMASITTTPQGVASDATAKIGQIEADV